MAGATEKKSAGWSWCSTDALLTPTACVLGIAVGLIIPGNPALSPSYRPISSVIGWVYFFNWCISFWPQAITNYMNKSTIGLAPDKFLYDIVGFVALTIYETSMYFSPWVRSLYEEDHNGIPPEVEINDVWFAWHSLVLTFVVITQMWYYDGDVHMPSLPAWLLSGILCSAALLGVLVFMLFGSGVFTYMDWLYLLSVIKVFVTVIKYIPQVLLNINRKSTKGWNIHGCWMDLIGAVLSILQFFLDCNDMNDWKGLAGNFIKLCLGLISGAYDVIFITQHYLLYPGAKDSTLDMPARVFVATAESSMVKGQVDKATKKPEGKGKVELGIYSQLDQDDEETCMLQAAVEERDSEDGDIFGDQDMDDFVGSSSDAGVNYSSR